MFISFHRRSASSTFRYKIEEHFYSRDTSRGTHLQLTCNFLPPTMALGCRPRRYSLFGILADIDAQSINSLTESVFIASL